MKKSPFKPLFDDLAEPAARDEVLERLRERIAAVARKRVPEEAVADVVQDTLFVLIRKLPDLDSDAAVLPYTFLILKKVIGNYYQKINPNIINLSSLRKDPGTDLREELELRIYREELLDLCRRTNAEYARIMELADDGFSGREIALYMQCSSIQALYNKIHRGRRQLREALEHSETEAVLEQEAV